MVREIRKNIAGNVPFYAGTVRSIPYPNHRHERPDHMADIIVCFCVRLCLHKHRLRRKAAHWQQRNVKYRVESHF